MGDNGPLSRQHLSSRHCEVSSQSSAAGRRREDQILQQVSHKIQALSERCDSTKNSVAARLCGFKSHLRYLQINKDLRRLVASPFASRRGGAGRAIGFTLDLLGWVCRLSAAYLQRLIGLSLDIESDQQTLNCGVPCLEAVWGRQH